MKRFIYLSIILIGIMVPAQEGSNRFKEGEQEAVTEGGVAAEQTQEVSTSNPGNPGDPTPIDDYIPLLLLAAGAIIILKKYRRSSVG